jgi:peroxiredoxin family protein
MAQEVPERFDIVLLVASAGYERFHELGRLVAAAAASGRQVLVVWRGLALLRLCEAGLDVDDLEARHGAAGARMSRAIGGAGLPRPSAMLAEARALGCVHYLACPTDVLAAGLDEATARDHLDGLAGLTTIVDYLTRAPVALSL